MKFVLFTSDLYRDMVADHALLFNQSCTVLREVSVLGFDPPTVKYPDNYKFTSMGKQSDFPNKEWASAIKPFIEKIEEENFVILWDDLFPIIPFNEDLFLRAEKKANSGAAQIIYLHCGSTSQYTESLDYDDDFKMLSQASDYRSGLAPAIWNKQYFLDHLNDTGTSWDFEVGNNKKMQQNDACILLCKTHNPPICEWFNVIQKGKFHNSNWNKYKNSVVGQFGWHWWMRLTDETASIIEKYKDKQLWSSRSKFQVAICKSSSCKICLVR